MFGVELGGKGRDQRLQLSRDLHGLQDVGVPRFGLNALDGLLGHVDHMAFPFSKIDGLARVRGDPVIVLAVHPGRSEHGSQTDLVGQPCLEAKCGMFSWVGWAIQVEAPVSFDESVESICAPMADLMQQHLCEAIVRVQIVSGAELQPTAAVGR